MLYFYDISIMITVIIMKLSQDSVEFNIQPIDVVRYRILLIVVFDSLFYSPIKQPSWNSRI